MKRIILLCSILLTPFVSSFAQEAAQEYKYEARLGWAPMDMLTFFQMLGEDTSGETTWGPMKTVGIFCADFDVRIKPWLTVGGKVNYRNSWRDMKKYQDGIMTEGIDRTEAFSIMPTVRLTSTNSVLRAYASVGLGPGVYHGSDTTRYYTAFQFTPGIEAGKKITWFLELGLGNVYCGLLTGIGWRF